MAKPRLYERNILGEYNIDAENWRIVKNDELPEKNRMVFIKRKEAIDMYLKRVKTLEGIYEQTGITPGEIYRLLKRCLTLDEFGEVAGYPALIPYFRSKKYTRSSKSTNNHSGSFSMLLEEYPNIKSMILSSYENMKTTKIHTTISGFHNKFLKWCHEAGIQENEYPFNTERLGINSLRRHLKKLELQRIQSHDEKHLQNIPDNNITINKINTIRPFQRVEFDGHRIDALFTLTTLTPEGDRITNVLSRIWLLAIIDVSTRVILGYHMSYNKEYNSQDILKCIKNAIEPRMKKIFKIPGLKYPDGGGYHSLSVPLAQWAVWDELAYDNAKSNLSDVVREKLVNEIGCSINAGPIKTPESRPIIERFFKTIEVNGFHRLPSTTGSNPLDPIRNDPERKAKKYEIEITEIEELVEAMIAEYNTTPHHGINGFTPLDVMKQRIEERGYFPKILSEAKQKDLIFLSLTSQHTIRGYLKDGKRPFVYYEGVEYRNDVLTRSPGMIGKKVILLVDTEDLRNVRAFLEDGSEFGVLTAGGKWAIRPHSLQMRRTINNLKKKKQIHFANSEDPVESYLKYLYEKSGNSKICNNRIAEIQRTEKSIMESDHHKISESMNNDCDNACKEVADAASYNMKVSNRLSALKKMKVFKTSNK